VMAAWSVSAMAPILGMGRLLQLDVVSQPDTDLPLA
jgi:hypothetical protein